MVARRRVAGERALSGRPQAHARRGLARHLSARRAADDACPLPELAGSFRIEPYLPGEAVSVAFLCGPAQRHALPPCRQTLSTDGRFHYHGGSTPLPPSRAARAARLADQAIAALPPALGYVGVDLILGPSPSGVDDFVLEINPRLTTSYVALRAASRTNLAAAARRSRRPASATRFRQHAPILHSPRRSFPLAAQRRARMCEV